MSIIIQVLENGPILVQVNDEKLALCRCGQSANKPHCDGAHARCNFDAPGLGYTIQEEETACEC
jgi:CDGSH-type Zn-finger protein